MSDSSSEGKEIREPRASGVNNQGDGSFVDPDEVADSLIEWLELIILETKSGHNVLYYYMLKISIQ